MNLNFGLFVILLVVLFTLYLLARKIKRDPPSFPSSTMSFLQNIVTWRVQFSFLPRLCFWLALFFIGISLTDPTTSGGVRSVSTKVPVAKEGITIYILIDRSGSMKEDVQVHNAEGSRVMIPKIDLVKNIAKDFIIGSPLKNFSGRPSDLIGIVGLARKAEVFSPPTLDHEELLKRLANISVVTNEDEDGTAIGYAIFKTVNLIVAQKHYAERYNEKYKPSYNITRGVILILTDGFQGPNPADFNDPYRFTSPDSAITYAEQNNIRVYYVGVDPVLNNKEFKNDVNQLKALLQNDGGFYVTTENLPLQEIISQIDHFEKEKEIVTPQVEKKLDNEGVRFLSHEALVLALSLLILAVFCETVLFRIAP